MFCRGSYLEFVAASTFCNYVLQRKLLGICSASIFWTPCGVGSLRDGLSRLKGYKAVTFCTHVAVHSLHSCGHTIVSSCTPWPYISACMLEKKNFKFKSRSDKNCMHRFAAASQQTDHSLASLRPTNYCNVSYIDIEEKILPSNSWRQHLQD